MRPLTGILHQRHPIVHPIELTYSISLKQTINGGSMETGYTRCCKTSQNVSSAITPNRFIKLKKMVSKGPSLHPT
jgi:hypothetical protein